MRPERERFPVPLQIRDLLQGFTRPWWVAGGWAVDLFLGYCTRPHKDIEKDIEIALFRHDQSALQAYLSTWRLQKVADGRRQHWPPGERLELPIHEIHGHGRGGRTLEILLNEHHDGRWSFRRDPRITRPMELLGGRSIHGVP